MGDSQSIMDLIAVKAYYGREIRRFSLQSESSFSTLQRAVRQTFGLEEQPDFVLKFKDDENDEITFSSDGELDEARRIALSARKSDSDEHALLCVIVRIQGYDQVQGLNTAAPMLENTMSKLLKKINGMTGLSKKQTKQLFKKGKKAAKKDKKKEKKAT